MGKTSLLTQIAQELKQKYVSVEEDYHFAIPVYIDMLDLSDATLQVFLGEVAGAMRTYLQNTSLSNLISDHADKKLRSIKTASGPHYALINAIQSLKEEILPTQLRVVVLIDNLWRAQQEKITLLYTSLRALHNEPTLEHILAYVITGDYRELGETLSPGSPLENILLYQQLHVFSQEESMKLINEPTGSKIPYEVARRVYQETGGHPFLLQYLMSELCEHADWTQLTKENVDEAIEKFHKERRDFERWWGNFNREDWRVYDALCQVDHASVDDLNKLLNAHSDDGKRLEVKKPKIIDALRILTTNGLIREIDGKYALAGRWPAAWYQKWKAEEG
jgi:AAA+ ATPase superfamily predicted ATPase